MESPSSQKLTHTSEIEAGRRFAFGANWHRFLKNIDDTRIELAKKSLCKMLDVKDLKGKSFLDAGSGSGLFSLAARQLGANIYSFDYDIQSVRCTRELKKRYFPDDKNWVIDQGSVLDINYISKLGKFDIVYSWGVLHHTGDMYKAFENISSLVSNGGKLFISIYNDQGWLSKYWLLVKSLYNKNFVLKLLMNIIHLPYLFGARWVVKQLKSDTKLRRGMSIWYDAIDWLGGYPFEVAKPELVFYFFREKGFQLQELKTCGRRMGCNEYVFINKLNS